MLSAAFPQKARTTLKGGPSQARRDSSRPNTHKESSRTSPSPTTTKDSTNAHRQHRTDRNSHVKAAFPVTVSYVSIQGGDDAHFELDTLGADLAHKKALIRTPTLLESPGRGGIRFERSKTSFLAPKPSNRPRLPRRDTDLGMNIASSLHATGNGLTSEGIGSMGAGPNLPKPAMPSQSYLEGMRGVSASSEQNSRSPYPHSQASLTPRSTDLSAPDFPPELVPHHRLKK